MHFGVLASPNSCKLCFKSSSHNRDPAHVRRGIFLRSSLSDGYPHSHWLAAILCYSHTGPTPQDYTIWLCLYGSPPLQSSISCSLPSYSGNYTCRRTNDPVNILRKFDLFSTASLLAKQPERLADQTCYDRRLHHRLVMFLRIVTQSGLVLATLQLVVLCYWQYQCVAS